MLFTLGKSIRLRMVGAGDLLLDSKFLTHIFVECVAELGSLIVKDAFRDRVSIDDVLHDEFCDTSHAADNSAGSVTEAAIHRGSLYFGGQNIS